jgi:hypothetical protein
MDNRPKPKTLLPAAQLQPLRGRYGVAQTVEDLLGVLARSGADPDVGALSLLTAFVQVAHRVIQTSGSDDADGNRETLLSMLAQARRSIDARTAETQASSTVH